MPLLHQDNSRAGGGDSRRSLTDLLCQNTQLDPAVADRAPIMNHRDSDVDRDWGWDQPSSPEVAETPRAHVPANCFPPQHPTAFASYSESARPGANWNDEPPATTQGITDLVASLKCLSLPAASRPYAQTSIRLQLSYDGLERAAVDQPWPADGRNNEKPQKYLDENNKLLPRRASFCGAVPSIRQGCVRWEGVLPPRCLDAAGGWSPKVFLGGLPWDLAEPALLAALRPFQPVRVEWGSARGFAYVTFAGERGVRDLLHAARRERDTWYYRLNNRAKEAQVIPWSVSESSWAVSLSRLPAGRTVFVGALHGCLSARALAHVMDDVFKGVVYAGIDTDKNKYPIGSGRVTFNNARSYILAVSVGYVEIVTDKFTKKVQILPYLEDSMCSACNLQQGPYFCMDPTCYRYFCRSCWVWQHPNDDHKPLTRSSKNTIRLNGNRIGDYHHDTTGSATRSSSSPESGAVDDDPLWALQ